jgi:hypothetical protein
MSKTLLDAAPSRVILLAPVIFILHVVEEFPGFVAWFNSLVRDGISQRLFLQVNVSAFVITTLVAALVAITREKAVVVVSIAWLSLLMLANALLHITGTLVHARYSPGTVTAITLYLPFFAWYLYCAVRTYEIGFAATVAAVIIGSMPMLAHGYLIIFEGSRLF